MSPEMDVSMAQTWRYREDAVNDIITVRPRCPTCGSELAIPGLLDLPQVCGQCGKEYVVTKVNIHRSFEVKTVKAKGPGRKKNSRSNK